MFASRCAADNCRVRERERGWRVKKNLCSLRDVGLICISSRMERIIKIFLMRVNNVW